MAQKVVSLIPSGTEIVSALGMADTLVGRSHCCDWPPEVITLPALTRPKVDPALPGAAIDAGLRRLLAAGESAYDIAAAELAALEPDVILTQDHCEVCAVSVRDVEETVRTAAALSGARVLPLHAHDLATLRGDFATVAEALGVPERGDRLRVDFDSRLEAVGRRVRRAPSRRVALLEWLQPPMVAGGWIPELAWIAGAEPVIVTGPRHFETVGWADVRAAEPLVVVFLPCGFGVDRTLAELSRHEVADAVAELAAVAGGAWVVDGDAYFNRPGPRLAESAEILARIVHAECFDDGLGAFADSVARWSADPLPQRTISVPSSIE